MGDRARQASAELDKLEELVKSRVITLTFALTQAFALGAQFQERTQRILDGKEES
jgi:hypothetical protein